MDIPIIYSPAHLEHDPEFEIFEEEKIPYAEKKERIENIRETLLKKGFHSFISPKSFPLSHILSVHQKPYVDFLEKKCSTLLSGQTFFPSYYIMDTYAPLQKETFNAAKKAVDVVLTGADLVQNGKQLVYALCRPPGHHAEKNIMGGYCYFNNAAIAANYLSQKGRVAILDIDFHHGNGTQRIFYDRSDVLYVSLHVDPTEKYPYISGFANEVGVGEGKGYTKNFPLPLGTGDVEYLNTLREAIAEVKKFKPDYLVVSLGFDTFEKDPICDFKLTLPFYKTMGEEVNSISVPALLVQEGGYKTESLGEMAYQFLQGFGA